MIELKHLTKKFGKKYAVENLSMDIENGKITMLIGPSGCGKTTTMKMINRLIEPSDGDIFINGESITSLDAVELRRSIGYVIQEIGLFPHMNVFDNIAVVPRLLKWEGKKIKTRIEELLDLVTLNSSYMYKYPLQLSGGERQRVGLARALAADPEVLLMDEPFGAIDPINRSKLHDSFLSIQEKIKKTIVFVTHDINEAIKLGDRIAILKKGNLVQYDNVMNILNEPENEFVENLLGHDRSLKALVLKKNVDYVTKDGYVTCRKDDDPEKIIKRLADVKKKTAYIIDEDGGFIGEYHLKKNKKDNSKYLSMIDNPITLERKGNLQQTFSVMVEAGESSLPVVKTKDNQFIGVMNITDIFKELKNEG